MRTATVPWRLAVVAVAWSLVAGCSGDDTSDGSPGSATTAMVREEGKLAACIEPAHSPFTSVDPTVPDDVTGLDVDVLRDVAGQLGLTLTLQPTADVELVGALGRQDCDLAAGGLTAPQANDASGVAVTRSYAEGSLVLVVRTASADTLRGVDDLAGRGVTVAAGTPAHRWVLTGLPADAAVNAADSVDAALDAVEDRSADAAVVDRFSAVRPLASRPGLEAVATLADAADAVFLTRTEGLRQQVNDALSAMSDDGGLEDLITRWAGPAPVANG